MAPSVIELAAIDLLCVFFIYVQTLACSWIPDLDRVEGQKPVLNKFTVLNNKKIKSVSHVGIQIKP